MNSYQQTTKTTIVQFILLLATHVVGTCDAFVMPTSKVLNRERASTGQSYQRSIIPQTGRNEILSNPFEYGHKIKSFVQSNSSKKMSTSDEKDVENPEKKLDDFLAKNDLKQSIQHLQSNGQISIEKERFLSIFESIETRTKQAEENYLNQPQNGRELTEGEGLNQYPLTSPARSEMTKMYDTLKDLRHLKLFGAAGNDNYPAGGSKIITPPILEETTQLSISALTPKPTNTLLLAGVITALAEGLISVATGIDLNVFIIATLFLGLMDSLLVNGAVFESVQRIVMPEYSNKIARHEAGHFLIAYLLGCPVEGCVLTAWEALNDERFGGKRTGVSAGTSFFDEKLSNQVNGKEALTRSTIDRYSTIVMAGIAAEAVNFGGADGGASDEMALIQFLTQISPRSGGAMAWNAEKIRNQARWGAMQAVLLIRHYRSSYEALVKVLEHGGGLGECIWAIETAAKEDGTNILEYPVGIVVDRGLYGEWVEDSEKIREAVISREMLENSIRSGDSTSMTPGKTNLQTQRPNEKIKEETMNVEDTKEFLKDYRETMEQRLKEIDSKLESLRESE